MKQIDYKVFDLTHQTLTHRYSVNKIKHVAQKGEVEANKSIIKDECGAENVLILNQVHSTKIIDADDIIDFSIEPEGDGAVTSKSKLVLAIRTGDCVPILAFCQKSKIIGAAHAGWQGALAGITGNLIRAMQQKGTISIEAIICPSISQANYEVKQDYYERFIQQDAMNQSFFIDSKNVSHYMFDLAGYVMKDLEKNGVTKINNMQEDTYSQSDKYPSYRRCFHAGEIYNQSLLSTIFMHDV